MNANQDRAGARSQIEVQSIRHGLVWLPIPLLLTAMIILWAVNPRITYESPVLVMALNFLTRTLASLFIIYLTARGFLATGAPTLLLLGCGVAIWASTGMVASAHVAGDPNISVTVSNLGVWLTALCHLAGSILLTRSTRLVRPTGLWLAAGYGVALGLVTLLLRAALSGWLPVFFVLGQGGTLVRHLVLGSAIAMFVLAVLMLRGARRSTPEYGNWYACALLLIAMALFGLMFTTSRNGPLDWTCRFAQYLGAGYLFMAALAYRRETPAAILAWMRPGLHARYPLPVGIMLVAIFTVVRLVFFGSLGNSYPFLLFNPAVMIAAIYGGFWAGALATMLSAFVADYLWVEPIGSLAMTGRTEVMALGIFVVNGLMMAIVSEAMLRARSRAIAIAEQARHVAEKARLEAGLRESEERLRQIFEGMYESVFLQEVLRDAQGRIVDLRYLEANPVAERQLGKTRAEIVGHTRSEVIGPLDPEALAYIQRVIAADGPVRMERYLPQTSGWYEVVAQAPLPDRLIILNLDITERKRAEEALRILNENLEQRIQERTRELEAANAGLRQSEAELKSLFESLPGLFLVLTPDLRIITATDAYLKATLTTREGIVGRYLFDVFPDNPEDPGTRAVATMQASIDRVIQKGTADTMALAKHDVRRPDGVFVERYWSPVNSPMFGADRRIKYILHRVEEVTEFVQQNLRQAGNGADWTPRMQQMEAEVFQSAQKVKVANQQLEAALKELESFSYSVSHDLRAPLRHLVGFVELLTMRETALDDKSRHYLQVIRGAASQMGRLIDDLLSFSRMGRAEVMRTHVELRMLLDEVIQELGTETKDRNIQWDIEDLPGVSADPAMLKLVFANLLLNAIKFTKAREQALIRVSCLRTAGEVVVSVRDNGVGFDMKHGDKLFNLFQRLHRSEEFEGTGLGLANVRRIIERHGGRTWAEGELNHGATFHFTLPCVKET